MLDFVPAEGLIQSPEERRSAGRRAQHDYSPPVSRSFTNCRAVHGDGSVIFEFRNGLLEAVLSRGPETTTDPDPRPIPYDPKSDYHSIIKTF